MADQRKSFVMALDDYKGPRPGVALTVAAVAMILALGIGVALVLTLSRSATAIRDGQQTVRALHRYTLALEDWSNLAGTSQAERSTEELLRVRDSIGIALRVELRELQSNLSDSADRALIASVLEDVRRPETLTGNMTDLGESGRTAMAALAAKQDSALFLGAAASQRAQLFAAILLGLTVLSAVVMIVPLSWVYVRYKQRVPPGL